MARRLRAIVNPDRTRFPVPRRVRQIALAGGVLLLGTAPAPAEGLLDWLLRRDVHVITTTEMTPAGALRRPASPEHPIYYIGVSAGYHDLGREAWGEKPPVPQKMIQEVVRVLANVGFVQADSQHPPTQCIIFYWGTLYRITTPSPWGIDQPDQQLNRPAMLGFLGGAKLGLVSKQSEPWRDGGLLPGMTRFDSDAAAIANLAQEDLYAITLAGYAYPAHPPKGAELLWRTRISCPARRLALADTLPTMLATAGPYIGRDTPRPVWMKVSDKFKPDIRIGNPKVEEYLDSGQWPILDAKTAAAKAKPDSKP